MPNSKYGTFRNRTEVNTNVTIRQASDFIEKSASSVDAFRESTQTNIKAVIISEQKEGANETILFTYAVDNVVVGEFITYRNKTYMVYGQYEIIFSNEFKKHKMIECNVELKWDDFVQKAYYISSLRRFQDLSSSGVELVFKYSGEKPVIVTKSNDNIKTNTRFLIKGEPFRVYELDKLSNSGVMYLSVKPDTILVGVDDLVNNKTETLETASKPQLSNFILSSGSLVTFTTQDGYFVVDYDVEILTKNLTSVEFVVPFGISQIKISTKNAGNVVNQTYKVVV